MSDALRILVVDDTEAQRYAVAHALRNAGFEVLEAANGAQAIELSHQNPDLILLDVKLPDMDGFQVCRRFKGDPRTAHIPVIQFSAYFVDAEHRLQGLQGGADDYVTNPASTEELVLKMSIWARVRRAEADLTRKNAELQRTKEELGQQLQAKSEEVAERKRAETISERLAQQHRLALDAAKLGWWHYDPVTEMVTWDNRVKEIFQLEGNANSKIDFNSRTHPDDVSRLRAAVEAALDPEHPVPYSIEYRIVLPDGRTSWVESYGMASFTGIGKRRHATDLVGTVADVTRRKLADDALRNSEQRYHSLFENMVEGFFLAEIICDDAGEPIDYRFLATNPALEMMTGLKPEQVVGKTVREALPGIEEVWIKVFGRVALTGEPARICDFAAPLGRFYETAAYSPHPGQFACIFTDVSERKQAEQAVRESEQRLRALVMASSDVVYRMSADWSEVRQIHGRGFIADTDEPSRSWLETYIPPEDRTRVLQVVQEAIRNKSIFEMEHRVCRADGGSGWTFSRAIPLLDSNGEIVEWFGVASDITERKRAEQALRESEQRLVIARDAAAFGIHDFNMETRTVRWDRRLREIWGLEYEEPVTYDKFMSGIHPDDRAGIEKDIQEVLNPDGNHRFSHEYRVVNCKTAQEHWVLATGQVFFEQRRPVRLVGTAQDITERKKAEEALRKSEIEARARAEELAAVLDAMPAMTFIAHDPECRRMTSSRMVNDVFRVPQGANVSKSAPEPERPTEFRAVKDGREIPAEDLPVQIAARSGRDVRNYELELLFNDGISRTVLGDAVPLFDENGQPRGAVGAFIDITERKRAEEALRQSEERFRTLADNMSQSAWMANPDGYIVWYNRRWYEYTGTMPGEMEGWGWTKVHHPDHVQRVVDKIANSFATGEPWEDTFPLRGNDGNYRWFLSRAVPIRDEQGKIVRWFGTNTDIDEQKRTQELLMRSEKVAALGRMAASLAHDINNPLAAVVNAIYLARNTKELPATIKQYLDLADEELMRIAHVTRQALGFYREESKTAPVAVTRIIEEAIDLFRGKLRAKDIRVEKNYDCDWLVSAISGELRQVFSNVVANSIDAVAEKGCIRVRVARSKHPKTSAPCVRISVADDGKGIDAADRPRIFEPLFTTKGSVGTGLGLWVSRQLIEKHGGSIRVRSSLDCKHRGTTLSILLPAQAVPTSTDSRRHQRKMSA